MIEFFAWQTDPGYALHILNYNNPRLHRGWIRNLYPIGPQQVDFELPADRTIAKVQLLRAERELPFTQEGRHVRFTVPRVVDYEVAALLAT